MFWKCLYQIAKRFLFTSCLISLVIWAVTIASVLKGVSLIFSVAPVPQ